MRKLFLSLAILLFIAGQSVALTTVTVLENTVSATQSDMFKAGNGESVTVIFTGTVGSGETADIQVTPDGGTTWVSDSRQLTDTELVLVIIGPGQFQVDKSATASAAGITITR